MNITGIVSSLEGDEATQMKFKRIVATVFSEEGGGGGEGEGGHNLPLYIPHSPASRTFLSLSLLTTALYIHTYIHTFY